MNEVVKLGKPDPRGNYKRDLGWKVQDGQYVQHRFYVGQTAADVLPQIQAAHQNGFRILLGVVGDQNEMRDYNSYTASYAAFVADAAAAGADAIEVWNEPNIDHEWPTGSINGANYTQMLAQAYTAIKARAPDAMASSTAISRVVTSEFSSTFSLAMSSIRSISSSLIGLGCEKSKRSRSGATSEPFCATWSPSTWRSASCIVRVR